METRFHPPSAPGTDLVPDTCARDLVFYLNGERVEILDVDPETLLLDWLRSSEVGLTGAKKGCGQGGCGLCTVMLSRWDEELETAINCSINSCMHPLAALDGMSITTIEGLGSTSSEVSPVQWEIAAENGSQCGYCTPGWVMTMHSALIRNGNDSMSKADIESQFEGNLCRCTGYRPILYAMKKQFANDWNPATDEAGCMTCIIDPAEAPKRAKNVSFTFPCALKRPLRQVAYARDDSYWARPLDLHTLMQWYAQAPDRGAIKLVVGNTSIGVYDRFVDRRRTFFDISQIAELRVREVEKDHLRIGGAVTYTELLEYLTEAIKARPKYNDGLIALQYMAGRTAGNIVRNAASLAGNTMLVAQHVALGTPFPSDLFTALTCLGVDIEIMMPAVAQGQDYEILSVPLLDFAQNWHDCYQNAIIKAYLIPLGTAGEFARTYKVAIRAENAHAIANACMRVGFDTNGRLNIASLVFGGIGPVAFRAIKTEQWLLGRRWNEDTLNGALKKITAEVTSVIEVTRHRMQSVPYEGFSDTYRLHLVQSYFFQFFVYVANTVAPKSIPVDICSAGERTVRPVTRGTQSFETYKNEYPVNEPFIKLSAFRQSTGEAVYTHDIPLPRRGLEAALVTSDRARAKAHYRIPKPAGKGFIKANTDQLINHLEQTFNGFSNYITCRDIIALGGKVLQGGGSDEPLLCPIEETVKGYRKGLLKWHGQQIGIVLADNEKVAQDIAHYIQKTCLAYKELKDPVLTIQQARAQKEIFKDKPPYPVHIWKITRADSNLEWTSAADKQLATVDGLECIITRNEHENGGQIHFYMETQATVAERGENQDISLYSSSQSPDAITGAIKETLNLEENRIKVRVKHVGGAYGGKTTRSPFTAAWAALAAWQTDRPVRLALSRAVDTSVVGRRHPLYAAHSIAIATGNDKPEARGLLMGVSADYYFDGGATYDCSFVVMDCLQLRSDSAYRVPNYQSSGEVCKTNKTSNTAFRAFGMIQSMIAYEDAIERAAHGIGMIAEDVRQKNLYQAGDSTPFGQSLNYCYMQEVWDYARKQSKFDKRLKAVVAFNDKNRWRKRGISLMPIKYGSGYNLASLEQGGAMIEVFKDGTVLIRQGGVEMGQGVWTKVSQIAAQSLNVDLSSIQVSEVDTQVIPNPTSTGASTGTALNGGAVKQAASILRARLEEYCLHLLHEHGSRWCKKNGVNFWDHEKGWRHRDKKTKKVIWNTIISKAFTDRINLSCQVRYKQHGGTAEDEWGKAGGLEFHPGAYEEVDHFVGFTFSAGCSEVEVDMLTGETTVLRSDIYYDMGKSLNPAIDVGQVEGAFIQGVGYVLTEELIWQPDGPERGNFYSLNTWEYKPPATSTIPIELNVNLYPRSEAGVAENPNDLMGAKEVGEPPLVLATTIYLAVKRAILASREEREIEGWFQLDAPATVQRVREAAQIGVDDLTIGCSGG